MQRVFLPPESLAGDPVVLPPDTAHYLSHVLRLRAGDEFVALDGSGAEYRLHLLPGQPCAARVVETLPPRAMQTVEFTLYQGLPRGKRFPLIIQKATELGAARIVAVTTARSQVHLGEREAASKLERWRKIAREAAEQCLRPTVPELMMAHSWKEALAHWCALGVPGLLLDETQAATPGHGVGDVLALLGRPRALAGFVGPEGGFAPEEAQAGRDAGLLPVSLGPRVLRTETAALVICTLVMYTFGQLG
ncbi:MAG: 16S rRNA (uracil(1498)-N(3))-methyltransferase [Armatimonadetes bacterium]|nr:16S rRNA (uracil(1498)-N(3))-methyltransferase [Armatimonadota bacterium]